MVKWWIAVKKRKCDAAIHQQQQHRMGGSYTAFSQASAGALWNGNGRWRNNLGFGCMGTHTCQNVHEGDGGTETRFARGEEEEEERACAVGELVENLQAAGHASVSGQRLAHAVVVQRQQYGNIGLWRIKGAESRPKRSPSNHVQPRAPPSHPTEPINTQT